MFKVRTLVEMLRSNRGSVAEETDHEVILAQLDEDELAQKEGREPVDLIAKSKEKSEKVDEEAETQEDPNEPTIEEVEETEEISEEEQTGEEEPKPEEEGEEEPETVDATDKDAEITSYAEKHKMTYAEAKEDIEKTEKIIEQFKGDPKEMARALRNKDREYDKLKNEAAKGEQRKESVFKPLSEAQFRGTAQAQMEKDPDKFIDAYKQRYPHKSELMSDEAIIEEMIDREWTNYQSFATKEEAKLSKMAIEARDRVISSIKAEDRRFIPDVKVYLEQLSDQDVLDEHFDPSYLVVLSKGKLYDADIKAAEARGYKRATEGKKILGVKNSTGKQGPTVKKVSSVSLNEAQRYRAEQMFGDEDGYTPEQAYQMFKDTFKKDLEANPNFVN